MAGLFAPWEAPPQFCPRPLDAALEQRVTKLAGYVRRNGADFQQHIREKQQGNPEYSFLFGGDGSEYYRWVLYCMVHNLPSEAPAPSGPPGGAPEGQSTAAGVAQLPPNITTGLVQTLSELTGSKDSIKSSRKWFLDNHQHSAALVAALMQHYRQLGDYQRMLHVIYMINDIVIHSAQMAPTQPEVPGIVNGAFQPAIPEVITMAFDKSGRQSEVRERLTRIVKLWAERSVYTEEAVQSILAASFQDPQQQQQQQQPTMMEPPPQPHLYPHQQQQQQHMPPQQQQLVPPQAPGAAAPWQGQPFAPPPGAVPPYGYNPGMAAPAPWAPAAPHQMPQQQHPMGDPMAQGGGPQVPWAQPPAGAPAAGGGAPHQPGPPMLHHPPAMHHHLPPVPMAPDPHGGAPPPWQQQQQQQHPAAMMPPPAGPGFPPHQAPAPGLAPAPSPAAAAAPWNAAPPLEHQFQPPPEEPQQPVNPMCFPPGILSSLLQKRDERPYEPLELDDIQREGLPDPNEPDAFLRSRIDKFYAEISGYYGTKTRSQVLSDRGQDPRGLLSSSRTDEPDHQQASTARFHEIDPATGMRADGSFAKPKGDRTKGGLGSHKREAGDDDDPDDVYGMYRKGRSGLYHSGSFASKARGRS